MPSPPTPEFIDLSRRLDGLERQVARWRRIAVAGFLTTGLALAAAVTGSAIAQRPAPGEMELRRLAIVDERGATRILMTAEGQDAFVGMTDVNGETRAMLQSHPGGARLVLGDGRPRLVLSADPGQVVATMSGPDGVARAVLGIGAGARETLLLARPDGRPSVSLP
ncbi:hypothetical protein EDC65_1537 [Stella humosa]|uniref:Uncharacterized protein n=1 Tax=Stella humosa TaxID=94 RepID=A0A3N1M7T5_9PROT|nr:hypothetical protein [Stella humosa]ROP99750.1 hypothetical protein EDC65_1537 [Stella humosa]BBK31023.1 hypothetical protein STHU_16570 [Stella humosa]